MIKLPHIIEKVYYEPWLITAAGFQSIHLLLESKLSDQYQALNVSDDFKVPEITATIDSDRIATIPISGVLGQRLSGIEKMCGGTDYLDIQKVTRDAINKGAKAILYGIDSSGGMVRGCSDTASFIKSLPVPTEAFTDTKASSAAYWLASACNGITASESSDLGSIGVILPWVDKSKLWEVAGLKYDAITNVGADLKGAGAGPSLTDTQRKYLQETVNYVAEQFQGFVNKNRKVKDEVFRAGTYFGKQALGVGLIDRVGSYANAHQTLKGRIK